jgi:hypothetical protein
MLTFASKASEFFVRTIREQRRGGWASKHTRKNADERQLFLM